jgi:hypothetical protein
VAHALVASLLRKDTPGFLKAPSYSRKIAEQIANRRTGGRPYVTLTVREIERDNANNTRTIKYDVWSEAIIKLREKGIETLVVRDTSQAFSPALFPNTPEVPEASIHLPTRLALYETAILNYTKNNDDDVIALSRKWYSANYGMNHGDQFPMTSINKKFIWDDEATTTVIQGAQNAMGTSGNISEVNGFRNVEHVKSSLIVAFNHLASQLHYGLLQEDITLFKAIKAVNTQFSFFNSVEQPLSELSGDKISQEVLTELFAH